MQVESGHRKGQPAKAPTTQEFVDFMTKLDTLVDQQWHTKNARAASYGGPIYVLDNAPIHNRGRVIAAGIKPERLEYEIPPRSPDFNKVAEHIHHMLAQGLMDAMAADKQLKSADDLKAKVKWLFKHTISTYAIRNDARSLKETFRQVVLAGGHYPPLKFM